MFYSNYGYISCRFMSKNTYHDLEIPVKSQSKSLKVAPFNRLGIVFYSNFEIEI